ALQRAGIDAVAPLGTALTEDQLELLWRVAPEPVLAFDGDEAGLRAAHRAAHLALPRLKPGLSLRFAFLPPGEDPDSLVRRMGAGPMKTLIADAEPLAKILWRAETEGKDFSTPERRAGLERALASIVSEISDGRIADYYRRDFEQKVFEAFKRRPARPRERAPAATWRRGDERKRGYVPAPAAVSPQVKASLIARAGASGARRLKEIELATLLIEDPELALSHGETLAAISFKDPSLDSLKGELLNLAASGFRLESKTVENHLVRKGMAELFARLRGRSSGAGDPGETAVGDDAVEREARFENAAAALRDLTELEPERARAIERFNDRPSDETWADAARLLSARKDQPERR
ncbi:MAG: toprim domain-containing protein, partial [Alphaproteobacteria bacterium]|nr:toprim domain-containing protein [Alphaproteobacteria bacterium]